MSTHPFPKNFLWGAATSAYQVEGAASTHGKGLSQQDVLNRDSLFANTEIASDHYHFMEEDVALLQTLGLRCYRFSISWPRIFPDGVGEPNTEGVAFYHRLLDRLEAAGIVPIVTMYHYDMPWALVEKYGGWLSRQAVEDFAYYAAFLVREYGDQVKHWITINEQNIIFRAWCKKNYIPEDCRTEKQRYQLNHHFTMAHAKAAKIVHDLCPGGKVSGVLAIEPCYPATSAPEDNLAAARANVMRNYFFSDPYMTGEYPQEVLRYLQDHDLMFHQEPEDEAWMKEGTSDFLAINYYRSVCGKACPNDVARTEQGLNVYGIKGSQTVYEAVPGLYQLCANPCLDTTDWDWPIDATGLTWALLDLSQRYRKPMMIAENGLGARDTLEADGRVHDSARIAYLKAHLQAIQRAMDSGVDLFGYCVWSALDLLSTSNGYGKRYGLIYVNRNDTQILDRKRYKKDSYYWYQKVIAQNGAGIEDIQ